jgi:deoxyribonuclease-4
MDAAHYGHLAGATDIVFHPGSYLGQDPERVLEKAIPRLRQCVDELRSRGNPVILRPETMGKRAMLGSLEDVLSMSREIDGVEPCIDFSHLHARTGDGSRNSQEEWKTVLGRIKNTLGARSLHRLHCHVSGIEYGEKGERKHLMLAESDMDHLGLLAALRDAGCSGRILCESPVMEEDAIFLMQAWGAIRSETRGPA